MTATAAASRALAPIDEIRQTLTRMEPEFATALPAHIPVERFRRVTLTAIQGNPDLLNADRRSLLGAVMKCAQDGLQPDGRDAALVVFRGKAGPQVQYMPMVGGLLKKIRQSGQLATIAAHVVYEADHFDYVLGDDERIEHKPAMTNRGRPVAAYAVAKLTDGSIQREVMTIEEIERVRAVSRAKDSGPWVAWWTEMARKTVLRRLAKYLPSTTELEQFWQRQDEAEAPAPTIEHQASPEQRPGPRRLREALATVSSASGEEIAAVAGATETIDAETGVITEVAVEQQAAEFDAPAVLEKLREGLKDQRSQPEVDDYWDGNRRLAEQLPAEMFNAFRAEVEEYRKAAPKRAAR